MAKANSNSVTQITDEDIADAEAQAVHKPVPEHIHREIIGSALVETNNMYVEDNTGKPLSAPAQEWESVDETIHTPSGSMKVTTYMDPVGGWPEEEKR